MKTYEIFYRTGSGSGWVKVKADNIAYYDHYIIFIRKDSKVITIGTTNLLYFKEVE